MVILTLTIMLQFALADPNDNVLKEQIEWDSISNLNACLLVTYSKEGSCMHACLN